jgi:membrane protein DedA with SNARE-associated domain
MSKTENRPRRVFLGITLAGFACFAALLPLALYTTTDWMMVVMLFYFSGIGLTVVGVVGLLWLTLQKRVRNKAKQYPKPTQAGEQGG